MPRRVFYQSVSDGFVEKQPLGDLRGLSGPSLDRFCKVLSKKLSRKLNSDGGFHLLLNKLLHFWPYRCFTNFNRNTFEDYTVIRYDGVD